MEASLSTRSLARILSDIAVLFSSGDQPEPRLQRAIELLQQAVPYGECGLLTLQPREAFVSVPAGRPNAALEETVRKLLADLQQTDQSAGFEWPRWNSHLAVPLVNPDVQIVGLLLIRHSGEFDDIDLRVLATVAGQLASYVSWLQFREERATLLARERESRHEADQANRAKDSFLATLSHELRSPLNAIVGWSDMLLRGTLPADTVGRALRAIRRNARAQALLIEDVLDVSRIISGKLLIERRLIDLSGVLSSAIEAIRPVADEKQIDLDAILPECPIPLSGDPGRLQQVFGNLLSNAVKFTPQGGRVRVSLNSEADKVEVRVEDTGIGIDAAALPRVFDRFFQEDTSTTRRHTGLGLGLAIVRHIVRQHGGAVHVESEGPQKGAVFTVTLPAEPSIQPISQMMPATPEADLDLESARLDNLTILVVDDEAETREMLLTLLSERGATVHAACGADDAIRRVAATPPDVVVADIAMPDKDGLTFIREVRERGVSVPAIALSAHGRDDDRLHAVEAGFDMHLAKPILPRDLVMAVSVLAQRRSRPDPLRRRP
jgi:signal transduction histidine kinase/ActR/RegA family two-component response regulator